MKCLKKVVEKDGPGFVKLEAEESEDMWHCFQLIRDGDRIKAATFRKVHLEVGGVAGATDKLRLTLTIKVESVDFDPDGMMLRVKGTVCEENEHVKLGSYHTIELEPHRAFTLHKDEWDSLDLDTITQACDVAARADLAVLLLTEGSALLVLVGGTQTIVKCRIEVQMPRKRGIEAMGFDKALEKFFARCLEAISRHIDFGIVKCLVLAGPGFTKEQFKDYVDKEAQRQQLRVILDNRKRMITAQASSSYKGALKEVLTDPTVTSQIKDTKAVREVKVLEDFFNMMSRDASRALYGPGHVFAASEAGAIQTLLLTDLLFRTNSVVKRRKYASLVATVEAAGGEVLILSAAHVSGEQLTQLSGIAAILRFPMPELEEMDVPPPPELA